MTSHAVPAGTSQSVTCVQIISSVFIKCSDVFGFEMRLDEEISTLIFVVPSVKMCTKFSDGNFMISS